MRQIHLHLIILILLPFSLLAEITVSARFNPPRIAMGDRAQYLVEIKETSRSAQPEVEQVNSLPIPSSGGLELRNGRTSSSQQTRIINGMAEYAVTQSLAINASAPSTGSFTIPGYRFTYKGETLNVPAAKLEVVERGADAGPSRDELIFLRANIPERLYVGQSVAFELKLYVSEEVRLSGLNRFDRSADGFTISELPDQSQEGSEMVEGRRYLVLSWPMTLTPIQTGAQELSFELGLTARLPGNNRSSSDPFGRSPFGGSLFEDFFGRTERLNVYSEARAIEVLPLPEEGRPESFSGAIGDFAMEVGCDAEQGRVGEPVMLSVELKGSGNFERIDGPGFPQQENWRIYDPEARFEASDTLGLRGSKRFDYVLIPQAQGLLEIPATEFSYFDPDEEKYITLTVPPIPIDVAAGTLPSAPVQTTPGLPAPNQMELELTRSLSAEEALLTLDYRPQPARPLGRGIFKSPLFIGSNLLAAIGLAAGCLALRQRRIWREDPVHRLRMRAKAARKSAEKSARTALRRGDADSFYRQSQNILRQAATARTGRSMQSAGIEELVPVLEDLGLEQAEIDDCRELFAAADARRFGRRPETISDQAATHFETVLKAL